MKEHTWEDRLKDIADGVDMFIWKYDHVRDFFRFVLQQSIKEAEGRERGRIVKKIKNVKVVLGEDEKENKVYLSDREKNDIIKEIMIK